MQLHRCPANINVWHAGLNTASPLLWPIFHSPLNNNNRIISDLGWIWGGTHIYIYMHIRLETRTSEEVILFAIIIIQKNKYIIFPVSSGLGVVLLCSATRTTVLILLVCVLLLLGRKGWVGDRLWRTEVPGSHGSCTMVETERDISHYCHCCWYKDQNVLWTWDSDKINWLID